MPPHPDHPMGSCWDTPSHARNDYFALHTSDWTLVGGSFTAEEPGCGTESLFAFDAPLLPGSYVLANRLYGGSAIVGLVRVEGSMQAGDCNGDAVVSITELMRAVAIAIGDLALPSCPIADADADGAVSIAELVAAVNDALH